MFVAYIIDQFLFMRCQKERYEPGRDMIFLMSKNSADASADIGILKMRDFSLP